MHFTCRSVYTHSCGMRIAARLIEAMCTSHAGLCHSQNHARNVLETSLPAQTLVAPLPEKAQVSCSAVPIAAHVSESVPEPSAQPVAARRCAEATVSKQYHSPQLRQEASQCAQSSRAMSAVHELSCYIIW